MRIYLIGRCTEIGRDTRNINMITALLNVGNIYYDGFIFFNGLKNIYIKKILNTLIEAFKLPMKLFYLLKSDIVILLAMNQSCILSLFLAKVLKKKIITDYYISRYDTKILEKKLFSKNSWMSKLYKFQDRFSMSNVSKVIFLNKVEAERYIGLAEIEKNINYEIIPLCKKELNLKKAELPFFYKKHKEMCICWWGTYISLHGLEKIILCGELLKKRGFKFKIYLFGNSEEKSKQYKQKIKELQLTEYIIINNDYSFLNKKLPEFLINNCDLAFGNFGDSEKAKTVMLNKIVDALQLGIPVLNGESRAPDEFFDYKNDIFKCLNTPKEIADRIMEISKLSNIEISKKVKREYEIYKENFSYNSFEEKIIKLIKNINSIK